MSKDKDFVIGKGQYYKSKDGDEMVAVFYVDMKEVGYAPVGSSKEVRTDHQTFIDGFEPATINKDGQPK